VSRPLVLFDCDGTLIDGQHAIHETMRAAFLLHGQAPPSNEAVRGVIGLRLEEAIARLCDGDDEMVAALARSYREIMPRLRQRADHCEPLYPGMGELVAALAANGVDLGVVTGKSLRHLRQSLAMHGLAGHFVTLQTPDNAPGKPHPGMVLQAMAENGAEPHVTIVVGDTTFDMEMARAAGVTALGVAWGYHEAAHLKAAGAHSLAGTVEDLANMLDEATTGVARQTDL